MGDAQELEERQESVLQEEVEMTQKEFEHNALQMRAKALAVAQGFGFSDDESEDVAQDVLLKLWAMHESIEADTPVERLASIAAQHQCIDRLRSRQQPVLGLTDVIAPEPSQHEELVYKELEEWLLRQIEQLPSTNGIILRMRQLEQKELDEIAALLGIQKSSVSTLLSRARHQLLQELKRRNKQ